MRNNDCLFQLISGTPVSDLSHLAEILHAIILPLIGIWSLVWTKICPVKEARRAEIQFLLTLVVITIVTLRTVIDCDDVWLVHTITLAGMIVGALAVPGPSDETRLIEDDRIKFSR